MNMVESGKFDVFVSHNSKDKPAIRELCLHLKRRHLQAWLDEERLQPGVPWQKLLEQGIKACRSVIVAIGRDGTGPWEKEEMEAALSLAVDNHIPVIPVLLPGSSVKPELPMFLKNRTWVDLHEGFSVDGMNLLEWGITGKASVSASNGVTLPMNEPEAASKSKPNGRRFRTRLNCTEENNDTLHYRNAGFIMKLCNGFPSTEFRIFRDGETDGVDPKAFYDFIMAQFSHGETVTVEVRGALEVMASEFFRVAWENLAGYSDHTKEVKARLYKLIDAAFARVFDPDLADIISPLDLMGRIDAPRVDDDFRLVVAVNDRLHDLTVPMIPKIAQMYECSLTLAFELGTKGVYIFSMNADNGYRLDPFIIDLEVGVGTQITILTRGAKREKAARSVGNVLQNLWQCDQWLRMRPRGTLESPSTVEQLIEYARDLAKIPRSGYESVVRPFISNMLPLRHVLINLASRSFTKAEVIRQLSEAMAKTYNLDANTVEDCVSQVENEMSIVPCPGFAILHAVMDWGPRLMIAFGAYPAGVHWSADEAPVKLVAMFVCARDAHRTWRDYMKRINTLFNKHPEIQETLLSAKSAGEFTKALRAVEESLKRD